MADRPCSIAEVEARLDALSRLPAAQLEGRAMAVADELLDLGEVILECWLGAQGAEPTQDKAEGFRLLALHRQAARGNPSFNACRETCREVVYHRNLVAAGPAAADVARTLRLAIMVVRHLGLFIGGKLEVAGLGDFCCSSRPIRQAEAMTPGNPGPMSQGG